GVESRRGLVEEYDGRGQDEADGEVEPPPHTARVGADALAGRILEPEALEQFLGPTTRRAAVEARELAHHPQVLGTREHFVDRGRLPGEADAALDQFGFAHDVVAGDVSR